MTTGDTNRTPRHLLLATDLGARSDRALDRAVLLAREWNAKLTVVHAVDPDHNTRDLRKEWDTPSWRRPPDPMTVAMSRIHADLPDLDIRPEVVVEAGDPAEVITGTAKRIGADLIVIGVARDEALGRRLLGDTVQRLVQKAPISLLVVRSRPKRMYGKVVVATDFSPSSAVALSAAARLFPNADFTLFNGYSIPYSGILDTWNVRDEFDDWGRKACDKFLAETDLPEGFAARVTRLVEPGEPERLLGELVSGGRVDLTVVGSHGGGALYEIFVGSTAKRIIDEVPGDVLLVRAPKVK